MVDLVFQSPPGGPDLVFGESDGAGLGDTIVTVNAQIPLEVAVVLGFTVPVTVQATIPLEVHVNAQYVSGASRPTVGETTGRWQAGQVLKAPLEHKHTAALPRPEPARARWQRGQALHSPAAVAQQAGQPLRSAAGGRFQQAAPVRASAAARLQQAVPVRNTTGGRFQQGVPVRSSAEGRWQDGLRDRRRATRGRWQEAQGGIGARYSEFARSGTPVSRALGERHQQAMKPPPGIWDGTIIVPPEPPCYTPSPHLVFSALWDGSPHLVFSCTDEGGGGEQPPAQVVVPVKKVYIVINETSLWRVDGNVPIPAYSVSLSLDADSWTWSFTASVPGQALAYLEPSSAGEPVELEARINGSTYRLLAENISRERVFGSSRLAVRGRGKSALLDAPYAPVMTFGNDANMTAQQLMNDVLTLNGVSIGWDVDWQLTDWLVPGGVWKTQGSYIAAANAIASAAGGYIQPHPIEQELRVLHRYPFAPWDWATEVTPDFELPADYTTRESIEWVEKARYNRVFVSGQTGGVLGQVTRFGTPGDVLAPMITDALITHADAARQRGRVVLSDTGRQARVTLRTPTDITGVIEPGKFVRYVDGGVTRLGIVRSTSVDVSMPEVWQTIGVETHV